MPQKKPRLLYFVTEDWYFLSHRLPLARGAIKAGFEVYLATRIMTDKDAERILSEGIQLIPIDIRRHGTNPLRDLLTVVKLLKIISSVSPDIVHNVAVKPSLYGSLVSHWLGVPLVVNAFGGMGYLFVSGQLKARILRPAVILAFRLILDRPHARVIFQNPDDQDLVINYGIIKSERSVIIRGSGVDIHRFFPTDEPQGPPVVLLASRLLWDKGIREFTEAARLLRDMGVKARFVLVGEPDPGNPASVPRDFITTSQEQGVIEWWGGREDMSRVFEQSHVVCLPSYREGLPKVLLEGAACARPLVATDTPGCREIVHHGENGFLVPIRDSQEMANYLKILIESPSLRQKMGAAGREMVVSYFSEEQVVEETLSLYHQCR